MSQLHKRSRVTRGSDPGATAVEYAIMTAFIALVIVAAVSLLGTNLSSLFDSAAQAF